MHRFRIPALAALAAAVALALALPAGAQTKTLTIKIDQLNNSGETGTAVLTQTPDGVQVAIDIKGAPATAQPTHIHAGTCGKINAAPEWPLSNTVGGKSMSLVKGVTIDQMLKTPYAINIHLSADDLAHYVACGDIAK